MIVDVAHASVATIDDVLAIATRPVVASHTGVRGVADNSRNLSDDHLRGIAATGGLIGIGFWPTACGGDDAEAIARSIKYATNVAGLEHVALGSDFDGGVQTPFDATGMVQVTDASCWPGSRTTRSPRSWAATRSACCGTRCPRPEPPARRADQHRVRRSAPPRGPPRRRRPADTSTGRSISSAMASAMASGSEVA